MLILVLFALVGLAELFMPQLVMLMAPGFAATPDRMAAAVDLARITMPYLPMISIVALWGAIANAHDRFKAAAAATDHRKSVLYSWRARDPCYDG